MSDCKHPKGHFWSANDGTQECLWCYARRPAPPRDVTPVMKAEGER